MKLLVLGGTRFLGRHLVDAAIERGHEVTIFTRGRTPVPWTRGVAALVGDRDPRIAPGLSALAGVRADAVVDCSGYVPRVVEASARLLASQVAHYVFVSSLSVYADASRPGLTEQAGVAALADPATEDVVANYGALKAACEATVARLFGARSTQVRPGLIVGPCDATDRFGYWVARFVHPSLLGERAPRAVVPAPPARPLQFVDARDLAVFILDLALRRVPGTFNACSPQGQWTMGALVDTLRQEAAVAQAALASPASVAAPPSPAWIDEATLVAQGVTPWAGLPLWLPASEPDSAGFMDMDCSCAEAAGLRTRALRDTVADTAAWLAARDNALAWKHTLSAEAERQILGAAEQLR